MSKRATLDIELNKDNRLNDPSSNLRKKIKVEHDFIISRVKRVNENLDLTDHKVNKFLIIFHTLLETIDLNSEVDQTDGIVTDIILQIVLKISTLIRQNVDSLPLPKILKDTLKVIKELFNGKKSSKESKGGYMEMELKECTSSTSSGSSSSWETTSSSSSSDTSTTTTTTATAPTSSTASSPSTTTTVPA